MGNCACCKPEVNLETPQQPVLPPPVKRVILHNRDHQTNSPTPVNITIVKEVLKTAIGLDTDRAEALRNAKKENFVDFSFNGMLRLGQVVSVYDGDTCRVVFYPFPSEKPIMTSVRMYGIDAPELKTKSEIALRAKARLIELVLGQLVIASFGKNDKYGRPLCTLFTDISNSLDYYSKFDNSVNAQLVREGLAEQYYGATKLHTIN